MSSSSSESESEASMKSPVEEAASSSSATDATSSDSDSPTCNSSVQSDRHFESPVKNESTANVEDAGNPHDVSESVCKNVDTEATTSYDAEDEDESSQPDSTAVECTTPNPELPLDSTPIAESPLSEDNKSSLADFNTPESSCREHTSQSENDDITNHVSALFPDGIQIDVSEESQEPEVSTTVEAIKTTGPAISTIEEKKEFDNNQTVECKPDIQKRVSFSLKRHYGQPSAIFGGSGTGYPATLSKQQLAKFSVLIPDGVDPKSESNVVRNLQDVHENWEQTARTAKCLLCGEDEHKSGSGGFLGYPVCNCTEWNVHCECVLLLACLSAPDQPECPVCLESIVVQSTVDTSQRGLSCNQESWCIGTVAPSLWIIACLILVALILIFTILDPASHQLNSTLSLGLFAVLFIVSVFCVLSSFAIGWFLDQLTSSTWDIYKGRLQFHYNDRNLKDDAEKVVAASLMAVTFLEYYPSNYPFPNTANDYTHYYCYLMNQ